jgi:hypothetical protein
MHDAAPATRQPRRRAWLLGVLVVLGLVVMAIAILSRPPRATRLLLDAIGNSLGLQVSATGGDYRLRGTPMLDVQGVVVREPGAENPMLRADRIVLSLPWSTIRGRGEPLTIDRIELQRPVVDMPALQHWLQHRPQGATRIPTLTRGLRITDGSVATDTWSITGITLDLPTLAPGRKIAVSIDGRYRSDALQVPFALHAALSAPENDAAIGIAGHVDAVRDGWRVPADIVVSGKLQPLDGGWQLQRARLQASGRYEAQDARVPFALGIAGTLQQRGDRLQLSPAAIATRGESVIPRLDAQGAIVVGTMLDMRLTGALQGWPKQWPQLPSPLDRPDSPLPFRMTYSGKPDFSAQATLQLSRDDAHFDGRFHPTDVIGWASAGIGNPLPPLDGHLIAPRIDIAGAILQGVDVTLDDEAADPAMQ